MFISLVRTQDPAVTLHQMANIFGQNEKQNQSATL